MCEYGFVERIDFTTFLSESTGGRPASNHSLKLDMAKEISMIQRNEKGRQAMIKQMEIGYQEMAEINLQIANDMY